MIQEKELESPGHTHECVMYKCIVKKGKQFKNVAVKFEEKYMDFKHISRFKIDIAIPHVFKNNLRSPVRAF